MFNIQPRLPEGQYLAGDGFGLGIVTFIQVVDNSAVEQTGDLFGARFLAVFVSEEADYLLNDRIGEDALAIATGSARRLSSGMAGEEENKNKNGPGGFHKGLQHRG